MRRSSGAQRPGVIPTDKKGTGPFARAAAVFLLVFLVARAFCAGASPPGSGQTTIDSGTEHIFICCIYGADPRERATVIGSLQRIGARRNGEVWQYTNVPQGKVYAIHLIQSEEGMLEALYTEKAHLIINGHSNYGMGGVFATVPEMLRQTISDIRYVDDDRLLSYSSPWVAVNIPMLLAHQSYPNWRPVFKDGTSAIMPYDFNDPRGNPPYNYYLTYQVPGDPTHYKIETAPHGALERFPDCGRPAWYAPDGSAPDPKNADQRKYFITNTNTAFQSVGEWRVATSPSGYYGNNYLSTAAGAGLKQAKWGFKIPAPGAYDVFALWPARTQNVASAQYTVTHASGATTVAANQQLNGGCWQPLGTFPFEASEYSVGLADKPGAGPGNVAADAIWISGPTNSPTFQLIVDNEACPKAHFGEKTMVACRLSRIDPARLRYKRVFYEGCFSGSYDPDVFKRGIMFYTVGDAYLRGFETYLRNYLQGRSDEQIWTAIQELEPVYDYFDFTRTPAEQCVSQPEGPTAVSVPSPESEARLRRMAVGSAERILEALRQAEFINDEPASHRLALSAFGDRKAEAVGLAISQLTGSLIERTAQGRFSRIRSLIAARRILEAFPEQSVAPLLELYARTNATTRGNILLAAGKIPGGDAIRELLTGALVDQRDYEGDGVPMRVCDVAYNQLVLRYKVKGVLRTLSPVHSIEVRQYHIGVLRTKLTALKG